jgi:hypothetical protein
MKVIGFAVGVALGKDKGCRTQPRKIFKREERGESKQHSGAADPSPGYPTENTDRLIAAFDSDLNGESAS